MKKDFNKFLKLYETATNSHNISAVLPFIAPRATYWFSDGRHFGHKKIGRAIERTWNRIKNEKYKISNVRWLVISPAFAVCSYHFSWRGKINGKVCSGNGIGTNVIVKRGKKLQMLHEHLSVLK